MNKEKLGKAEVESLLEKYSLTEWTFTEKSIQREFTFRDFLDAFSFLTKVAIISEKLNHHPDWSGVYNKVNIKLQTHEVGGVTLQDIMMASDVQKLTS